MELAFKIMYYFLAIIAIFTIRPLIRYLVRSYDEFIARRNSYDIKNKRDKFLTLNQFHKMQMKGEING